MNRRLSRRSFHSNNELDDADDETDTSSIDSMKKISETWFRTPFLVKILKWNSPEWHWILLATTASFLFGSIQPLFAFLFSQIYGLFADPDLGKQERDTRIYAIGIFCIGAVGALFQFVTSFGFAKSGEALTMRMRKVAFAAILRQEISYFDSENNSVGALVTRLSSDAAALKGLTGTRIGLILQAFSAAVTALAIAFASGWKLTLVALSFTPLLLLMGGMQSQKQSRIGQTDDKGSFADQGGQHAAEAIEHIRTVVALHRENHFIDVYEYVFNQEFKNQLVHLPLPVLGAGIANSVVYFLQCAVMVYGSQLVQDGQMEFNNVFRVLTVITLTTIAIGRAFGLLSDYSKAKYAALRIMRLHNRQTAIDPNDDSGIILDEIIGNIEFRDVRFRYANRPTVRILRNFTLTCSANGTTALVGPSGSGKSTLIALLQRFYDPIEGKVLLDGHDIRALNIQWLRSLMGLVQQEPVLFNLSIRDNIAYGDNSRQVTPDQIENAARMANIHEFIISLPQGYETLCGAKGTQLSGGQKQRIAIARALIRSPKILLLDEATSALDNSSEKVVQAALDKARAGRTCVTIAHRLSTISNSEKIAVVDRGMVKEEGTHEELLEKRGVYAKLALGPQRST